MGRITGMDYRNGPQSVPLSTVCVFFGTGWPQKLISPRNMQVRYPKIWLCSVGR